MMIITDTHIYVSTIYLLVSRRISVSNYLAI